MQLSKQCLAPKQDVSVQFECIYNYEIIDINNAYKCYECDAAISETGYRSIQEKNMGCPKCSSTKGFKYGISEHHKDLIRMLKFQCPNQECGIKLNYEDACKHIPKCQELSNENRVLKQLIQTKDEKIITLNNQIKNRDEQISELEEKSAELIDYYTPHDYEWVTLELYHVKYWLNKDYKNTMLKVKVKDTDSMEQLRQAITKAYGYGESTYLISWVVNKQIVQLYNNQQTVKEIIERMEGGLTILYEIPEELNAQMPTTDDGLTPCDSNHGIEQNWVKVCVHVFKQDKGLQNLTRFIWAQKDWTLKELHQKFFEFFRDLFVKWYKDGGDAKSKCTPKYKHPGTSEILTFESLEDLIQNGPIEDQIKAFFPNLTEDNWSEELNKRKYAQEEMPYQLKVQNISKYGSDCFFCGNSRCTTMCALPYSSDLTVVDMLHKARIEDNVSFYNNKRGKEDFIVNMIWNRDFKEELWGHLTDVDTVTSTPKVYIGE